METTPAVINIGSFVVVFVIVVLFVAALFVAGDRRP